MSDHGGNAPKARPVTSAFLVCDRIIIEDESHKKALIGLFTILRAPSFPTRHGPIALYYQGTVESGEHEFHVDFVRRGDDSVLAKIEGVLIVGDGESPTELAANLPFIDVPSEGRYEFRLWIDGAYVQRASFAATMLEKRASDHNDN